MFMLNLLVILFLLVHSELLLQNTGLTIPILDALSNLSLRPELLAEVGDLKFLLSVSIVSAHTFSPLNCQPLQL